MVVDIARKSSEVIRVSHEKHPLDSSIGSTRDLVEGIDGCRSALGVPFKDEAFVRAGLKGGLDLVDNLLTSISFTTPEGRVRSLHREFLKWSSGRHPQDRQCHTGLQSGDFS